MLKIRIQKLAELRKIGCDQDAVIGIRVLRFVDSEVVLGISLRSPLLPWVGALSDVRLSKFSVRADPFRA